jgi:uncharacterized membrane-anchored protein YitT (DUF2179 family)
MKGGSKIGDTKAGKIVIKFVALTVAACIFAFNLKSFIRTGNLIPGGFSGITVLVQQIGRQFFNVEIPYSLIYLPINLIPVYIGLKYIGKFFTLESFYVVALSSILTDLFPDIYITYDTLLIAVFGGLVNSAAGLLCLLAGASGGGTDFISIYMSEKKGVDAWGYILAGNLIILTVAGILFGFDRALYSIIYQYVITVALGTLYKRYQRDTLLVVTEKPREITEIISKTTQHDTTLLTAEGGYTGDSKTILYSVVGRDQVDGLIKEIKEIDPKAFMNVIKTEQVNGRFYMRPKR